MADLDLALDEAIRLHDPGWRAPEVSAWMRRQRAELIDIERVGDEDDEDDFVVDDAHPGVIAAGPSGVTGSTECGTTIPPTG